MRLIDLDDALESIKREIANVACPNTVLYVLENRPQVDAIPIDWINKYIEHMTNIFGPMDILTMLRRYEDGFIPSVPEKGPIE